MNNNRREKKFPLALIALIALNLNALNALIMSAEKLTSSKGDPSLLLCGHCRPKKKKARYLLRPYVLSTILNQQDIQEFVLNFLYSHKRLKFFLLTFDIYIIQYHLEYVVPYGFVSLIKIKPLFFDTNIVMGKGTRLSLYQ